MKRIAVSQRVERIERYGETRDCLDQLWASFMEKSDLSIIPIPNSLKDVSSWLKMQSIDGFILSGGNDIGILPGSKNISFERDSTEKKVLDFAIEFTVPVIGVCRGMQFINLYFGGKLDLCDGHVAKRHEIKSNRNSDLITHTEVNSYHTWGITNQGLSKELRDLAVTNDGGIEAFVHRNLPIYGIMWHPEREINFRFSDINMFKKVFYGK